MARFQASGMDDLIADMARYGQQTGKVARDMLQAGADIMVQEWKNAAEEAGLEDTRSMIDSIGYSKIDDTHDALFVDVFPKGKDKRGIRNAEKAFINHYGTSRHGTNRDGQARKGNPATRFIDKAEAAADPRISAEYEKIWNNFIEGGK